MEHEILRLISLHKRLINSNSLASLLNVKKKMQDTELLGPTMHTNVS